MVNSCICDEVTKAMGGTLINCPAHGHSFVLDLLEKNRKLHELLAQAMSIIENAIMVIPSPSASQKLEEFKQVLRSIDADSTAVLR